MPRRFIRKRNPRKRRNWKSNKIRRGAKSIPRSVNSAAVFHFKRTRHEIVSVGTAGLGWLLNTPSTAMYKTFDFRLSELSDNTDFVNLFRYYKINAVRVRIWPCNNYTGENAYTGQFSNSQLMLRYDQNQDGVTTGNDYQAFYQTSQTARQQRLITASGKPVDILMRLKQSNMVYKQLTGVPPSNTGYTLMNPRWTTTDDPDVGHYGMNMLVHRMSDDALTTGFVNQQKLRVEYTYYISCKKVQ